MPSALNRLMPVYEFSEHHQTVVNGTPADVFAAIEATDLSDSRLAQVLMAIWRIPARVFMPNAPTRPMTVADFIPLAHEPPREIVRGLIAGPTRRAWTPQEFVAFEGQGFKLAWSFWVTPLAEGRCRVDTETRVHCNDAATQRWFTLYWIIIRLPSGAIRRDMLRIIRGRVERGPR